MALAHFGAGHLSAAPYGTAVPTSLSSTLDPAFVPLGGTQDGSTFTHTPQTADVFIEESKYAIATVVTGITETLAFTMADYTANNLQVAFNNAVIASPTGATTLVPGSLNTAQAYLTIVWDSDLGDERWVYFKCSQTGAISIARKKENATPINIPVSMSVNYPADGVNRSFKAFFASTLNTASVSNYNV